MKKLLAALALVVLTTTVTPAANAIPQRETKEQLLEATLLTSVNDEIQQAVRAHYKNDPPAYGLYDAKVLDMQRDSSGSFTFTVKIQIRTYHGPHNPPHNLDTITLRVEPGETKVLQYVSQPEIKRDNQT